MSGCGCKQYTPATGAFDLSSGADAQAALDQWALDVGADSAPADAASAFLAMTETLGATDEDTLAADELAQVAMEDDMQAMQELEEAMQEAEPCVTSLDEILAIAKARPGLKITFSF